MEGPFISREKRGAWMPEQLRSPSVDELRAMHEAAAGTIRSMTIAPELPGALKVAAEAAALGIQPAIGHTNASYEEACAGIDAGMTIATHTFNGMRGLHHRDPGALGAVLASRCVDAELIADGQHVSRGAIEVLLAAKGADRVMLVTDNVALAGVAPGEYGEGRWRVTVSEAGIRLTDGTIAGSVLPFNKHVALMADIAGVDAAIRMASISPARVFGVSARKGALEAGMNADLVALSPELDVRLTISRGRIIYRQPSVEMSSALAAVG
jgi:N-acetylglucosamine-6-phosphate deacetylase